MEAKQIDFKLPLEVNLDKVKNNHRQNEGNDFTKKLDSITKGRESNISKTNKTSDKDKVAKEVIEDLLEDEKISYEGMINLLNIQSIIEEEVEVGLEDILHQVEEILVDLGIPEEVIIDSNLNEKVMSLLGLDQDSKVLDTLSKDELKDLIIDKLNEMDQNENTELSIKMPEKKQNIIKTEFNESEEDQSINEETPFINLEKEDLSEEISGEAQGKRQDDQGKAELEYELVSSSKIDDSFEVGNEGFSPFIKEGVELLSENPLEVEIPIEPKEVIEQIIDQVKYDISENKNEMKLTLKPEELGEMIMNIEVAKDGVIAKIMVDNHRTKEIIENNMIQLKEGIEDTGMEIKTFEVFVGNNSDFDQHNFNEQFKFQQNNRKIRVKANNKENIEGYEEGTIDEGPSGLRQNTNIEGGLNLLA